MSRLRRLNSGSSLPPVAAEVLELRDLLSSGGAAVHLAQQHAALQTQALEPLALHANVQAALWVNHHSVIGLAALGKVTVPTFSPTVGSRVIAKFSLPSLTANQISVAATFSGRITSIAVSGSQETFTIAPTGGSLMLKEESGNRIVPAKALPDGSDWNLVLENGGFQSVSEMFKFAPTAPAVLVGLPVFIKVGQ